MRLSETLPHAETRPPAPRGTHLPALDGVRGLAVLLVLVFHFAYYSGVDPTTLVDRVAYKVLRGGWVGVDLFFVLSGFLITGILWDTRRHPGRYRNFYARRVLRIFPLYYAALALLLVAAPAAGLFGGGSPAAAGAAPWAWAYLSNVLVALRGWEAVPLYVGHFWSLAVEEQFYLVWPLAVFLLPRRWLVALCLGCMGFTLALRTGLHLAGNEPGAYVLTFARMDGLAVGALLAVALRTHGVAERAVALAPRVAAVAGAALAAVFVVEQGFDQYSALMQTVGYSLSACFFGAVVLMAATSHGRVHRAFSNPALRWLGRYSYGLYVFHVPVVLLLRGAGFSAARLPLVGGWHLPAQLLVTGVATALTAALALLSWNLLEKHCLRLKDRFAYETEPRAAAPQVAVHRPRAETVGS